MAYLDEVLADLPLAYWPLVETTGTPVDRSPNGKTLALINGPLQGQPGPFRDQKSIALDGLSQRLDSDQGISHSKYTIEFWYKGTDTEGIVASPRNAASGLAVRIGHVPVGVATAGCITFGVSGSGVWAGVTTTKPVNDNVWHHIVCVWDGEAGTNVLTSQFKVYVDKNPVALTDSVYQTQAAPISSGGAGYKFGNNPADNENFLAGQLSNIALYGSALPAARVLAHYRATQRRVPGVPWAVQALDTAGDARTEVRVSGEPWLSAVAQATEPIVVAGEPISSNVAAGNGVVRLAAPVSGDPWSVGAGAGDGTSLAQIIVRAENPWAVAAGSGDGYIYQSPDPFEVDFNVYPTDVYRYFVFDILTDEILAEVQMNDVSFNTKINSVGDLSGVVYAIDAQPNIDLYWATMPIKTALYVLRGEKPVWGGIIWNREYDVASKQVTISAGTWESYLFRRYIWHTFETEEDTDQYDVVRKMLTRMRHDFEGSYDPEYDHLTPVRDNAMVDIYVPEADFAGKPQNVMTFMREELKSFGEALTEYADNLDGFEWYFAYTYNKKAQRFRRLLHFIDTPPALMKKGSPEPSNTEADKPGIDTYLFEYPGNIITVQLSEDGDNACTRQFVAGGPPAGMNIEGYRPIGAWNNEEYLAKGFPLVENVESSKHATTSNQKRLNRLATVYGREAAPPIRRWSVTVNGSMDPVVGTYRLGHWCRLVINDEFIKQSLNAEGRKQEERGIVKRIVGISVNVPTGPQLPETVTLELEDDVVVSWEPPDDDEPDV